MEGNAKIEAQDTCNVNERFPMMAAVDCPSLGRVKGQWYKAVPPLVRCHTGLTPADYFNSSKHNPHSQSWSLCTPHSYQPDIAPSNL